MIFGLLFWQLFWFRCDKPNWRRRFPSPPLGISLALWVKEKNGLSITSHQRDTSRSFRPNFIRTAPLIPPLTQTELAIPMHTGINLRWSCRWSNFPYSECKENDGVWKHVFIHLHPYLHNICHVHELIIIEILSRRELEGNDMRRAKSLSFILQEIFFVSQLSRRTPAVCNIPYHT